MKSFVSALLFCVAIIFGAPLWAQGPAIDTKGEVELLNELDVATGADKLVYMVALAEKYASARNVSDGVPFILNALRHERLYPDERTRAQLRHYAAVLYTINHAYEPATEFFNLAIEYFRETNDVNSEALALAGLAIMYSLADNYTKSLEYDHQVLEIFKDLENEVRIQATYNNIATKKLLRFEYEAGTNAHTISPQNLSANHTKELVEIDKIYHEILNAGVQLSDPFHGVIYFNLGLVNNYLGNSAYSIDVLNKAIAIWRPLKSEEAIIRTLTELARAHYNVGDFDQALAFLTEAEGALKSDAQLRLQLTILKYLPPVHLALGRPNEAQAAFSRYKYVSEKFTKATSTLRVNASTALADIRRKDDQIERLNLENQLKEADLAREKALSNFQLTGIGFLTVLLALLWGLWRARVKAATVIEERNKILSEQALTDALTGLYNRRAYENHIEREAKFAKRSGSVYSIAMLDIDHFKLVNDEYGHAVGDKVLQTFAKVISDNCREEDIVCRWGGEEFTILFRATEKSNARDILDRIQNDFQKIILPDMQGAKPMTFSAGLVDSRSADTWQDLQLKADAALFEGKTGGREAIVVG